MTAGRPFPATPPPAQTGPGTGDIRSPRRVRGAGRPRRVRLTDRHRGHRHQPGAIPQGQTSQTTHAYPQPAEARIIKCTPNRRLVKTQSRRATPKPGPALRSWFAVDPPGPGENAGGRPFLVPRVAYHHRRGRRAAEHRGEDRRAGVQSPQRVSVPQGPRRLSAPTGRSSRMRCHADSDDPHRSDVDPERPGEVVGDHDLVPAGCEAAWGVTIGRPWAAAWRSLEGTTGAAGT